VVVPQQTNMLWLDLDAAGIDEEEWEMLGREAGLSLHSSRVITHYQVEREAVEPGFAEWERASGDVSFGLLAERLRVETGCFDEGVCFLCYQACGEYQRCSCGFVVGGQIEWVPSVEIRVWFGDVCG